MQLSQLVSLAAILPSFVNSREISAVVSDQNFFRPIAWSSNDIRICWENAERDLRRPKWRQARLWVKSGLAETWGKYSGIKFSFEDDCQSYQIFPGEQLIRVNISDEQPHVKAFGSDLHNIQGGLVLNFDFLNWLPACQDGGQLPEGYDFPDRIPSDSEVRSLPLAVLSVHKFLSLQIEYCVKVTSIHQFGHALGFVHMRGDEDSTGWCHDRTVPIKDSRSHGVIIPTHDKESIMNFCSRDWRGHGKLSLNDIVNVQSVYGPPGIISKCGCLHEPRKCESCRREKLCICGDLDFCPCCTRGSAQRCFSDANYNCSALLDPQQFCKFQPWLHI